MEEYPIQCYNEVDDTLPPTDFTYVCRYHKYQPFVVISSISTPPSLPPLTVLTILFFFCYFTFLDTLEGLWHFSIVVLN